VFLTTGFGDTMDYRYGGHTIFKIQYHFVFVAKSRYQILKGDVGFKSSRVDSSDVLGL